MEKKNLSEMINKSINKCEKEVRTAIQKYVKDKKYLDVQGFEFVNKRGISTSGDKMFWNDGLNDAVIIDLEGVNNVLKDFPLDYLLNLKDYLIVGKIYNYHKVDLDKIY